MTHIQIIYINGPSSAGKTVLAQALQKEIDPPFLYFGIDHVIDMMPEKVNIPQDGKEAEGYSWKSSVDKEGYPLQELKIGPFGKQMDHLLKEIILTLAKLGHHVIVDDVAFNPEEVEEWREILKPYQVLWVGLKSPLTILEEREKKRGDRMLGSTRWQFARVHKGVSYDLEFDTSTIPLEEMVKAIREKL